MKKNEKIFLLALVTLSAFLYFYRLTYTQLLIQDTARDTLKVLNIWQTKTVTLIGPPASFSLNSTKEFYFGSFSYYLGLFGLLIANFNPSGATIPTILLNLISIPFLYFFLKNIKASNFVCFVATTLYVVSPLTVTHMRFFWNPNTIIPLSVFYWYFATINKKGKLFETGFLSGVVSAIIFNFHYFMVIPMAVWGIVNLVRKNWDSAMGSLFGFLIGTIPLFLFELKHDFYLSNSLVYNLQHKAGIGTTKIGTLVERLGETFTALVGIKSGEINYASIFNFSNKSLLVIEVFLAFLLLVTIMRISKNSKILLLIPIAVSIFFAAKFSDSSFYVRYTFGAYPLAIWLIAEALDHRYFKYLLIPIFILVTYSNYKIITYTPSLATGYIPLQTVEKIAEKIVSSNPEGRYNLSENIFGDAQALGLRYFVQKDAKIKPQGIENYGGLNTLYVVSPSLEKTKSDNRWEFYASAPWKEPKSISFGEVNLYIFSK